MRQTVDARGLACPQPVVLTLRAITNADEVTTIVDNPIAVENVTWLAHSQGCSVQVDTQPDVLIALPAAGTGTSPEKTGTPGSEQERGPRTPKSFVVLRGGRCRD